MIEQIHVKLKIGSPAALSQPQAISGLGGIGKTQTAIEYAYLYRTEYQHIFFVRAETKESIESGYLAIAQELDLKVSKEADLSKIAIAVRRYLSQQLSGWLLILDNADDVEMVAEFLPEQSNGHTILTTREHDLSGIAEKIELPKLSLADATQLLLYRIGKIQKNQDLSEANEIDRGQAEAIVKELDGLPLAIAQAGAYIAGKPISLTEYLSLYKETGTKIFNQPGRRKPDHAPVTITFILAFQKVIESNIAAGDLIKVCAFLAADAIPEEIFIEGGDMLGDNIAALKADRLQYYDAIAAAVRYSLIKRDVDKGTLEIHRLVQAVIKDEMSKEEQHLWSERVVNVLYQVFPDGEYQNWPKCERLISHARKAAVLIEKEVLVNVEAGILLHQSAYYLKVRALYQEAELLSRQSLKITEQALGREHHCVASTLNNLAAIYHSQGRYQEVESLLQQSLKITEQALGSEHPRVANLLNNLAALYESQGKYKEAEPLYERALKIYEQVVGSEHYNVATTLNNLAEVYRLQDKYKEAEPLYEQALKIYEQVVGTEHPNFSIVLDNLAGLYCFQGKYKEAEPLYEQALKMIEQALGSDHPDVATTLNNLAYQYYLQGKHEEAEPLYKRALKIKEQVLGSDHPDVAPTLTNLALLYRSQCKFAKADPLFQRAIKIIERKLGKRHPNWIIVMGYYANMLISAGRISEAKVIFQRMDEQNQANKQGDKGNITQ